MFLLAFKMDMSQGSSCYENYGKMKTTYSAFDKMTLTWVTDKMKHLHKFPCHFDCHCHRSYALYPPSAPLSGSCTPAGSRQSHYSTRFAILGYSLCCFYRYSLIYFAHSSGTWYRYMGTGNHSMGFATRPPLHRCFPNGLMSVWQISLVCFATLVTTYNSPKWQSPFQ